MTEDDEARDDPYNPIRELSDRSPMPAGKHQGTPMEKVPATYLDWLIGQQWIHSSHNPDWIAVRRYILANLKAIQAEIHSDD